MKIPILVQQLKRTEASLKKKATSILNQEDKTILALLKEHSPVDSGDFSSNWKVARKQYTSKNTWAELVITNDTPGYGQFAAFGTEPKQAPWYYPHRDKKSGKFKKGTGKLKQKMGKVWAGGLNPGHDKTVGGPIAAVMSQFSDKFAQDFVSKLVRAFV